MSFLLSFSRENIFLSFLVRCSIKECAYSSHAKGESFQRETDTEIERESVCVFVRK